MNTPDKIQQAYQSAVNYPDLAKKLIEAGILSYTVEVATGTILYRAEQGENILHPGAVEPRTISQKFNEQQTIEAIRNNQQGKTNYSGFMNDIAAAGVRFYEATLNGNSKRVTYVGYGGSYEERIPIMKEYV